MQAEKQRATETAEAEKRAQTERAEAERRSQKAKRKAQAERLEHERNETLAKEHAETEKQRADAEATKSSPPAQSPSADDNAKQLADFLGSLGLSSLTATFTDQDVSFGMLLEMALNTEKLNDTLGQLGLKVGHRVKIADGIRKRAEQQRQTEAKTASTGGTLSVKFEDVSLGAVLGKGASGIVYKAQWKGITVAAKELVVGSGDSKALEAFEREVQILLMVLLVVRVVVIALCSHRILGLFGCSARA